MKMTITGRNVTIRPSFAERTKKKLSKLDKFFDEDATCVVTVTQVQHLQQVEATVRHKGLIFRAEVSEENAQDAVDKIVDVLFRQIRKYKTKLEKRLRENAFMPDIAANGFPQEVEEEEKFEIVRTKTFPVKPMDVEEAILQMNMLGHQFFMFRNMDTNEINVVYKRKNGGYGLLEPEEE